MNEFYNLSINETLKSLKSSEKGLSKKDAEERLKSKSYNELVSIKGASALTIFFNQFSNWLMILLIIAGVLSFFVGDIKESIAILVIIFLNTLLGFIQEYNADKAIKALEKIAAPTARVIRDGQHLIIPARELVPGDLIELESGDIVPADVRLIEVSDLQIEESSLTGESVPSIKQTHMSKLVKSIVDQENMAFCGTIVTYGKGIGIVTATGMDTELGKIAVSIQSTEESKTPLQNKFEKLSLQIGIICIALVVLVGGLGLYQGIHITDILLISLTLIVSTVPNSLPLVVTIGLTMGSQKLAKQNMLIKRLPAAESLGAATMICTDKTGTLTKNQMTVTKIYFNEKSYDVSGSGYTPSGNFYIDGKKINPKESEMLIRASYLCNNAKLSRSGNSYGIIGDPTEGALIVLGAKSQLIKGYSAEKFHKIKELPFDSDRKRMSMIFSNKTSRTKEAYVKGAPDVIIELCTHIYHEGKIRKITNEDKEKIAFQNNSLAEDALRVLALAYKEVKDDKDYSIETIESGLVFLGLTGMIDPPREEAKIAIEKCHDAGIMVMMITGDHPITAKAVAERIGLYNKGDIVLTGDEIDRLKDEELEKRIGRVRIIARALPIQKSRIVWLLQKQGHIVAMTGDGVNDAPALKKADIGIAMGITGTDVAKSVAKATLVDDNFATIVKAIETGRNIYDSLIRSAKFFLSCNSGEIFSVIIALMLNFPVPLIPLQLLIMNMLTDNLPALGLGFESAEEGVMKRRPRNPKEAPLSRRNLISIVFFGIIMGIGTIFLFSLYDDLAKARTVAFTTLVMFQMFAVISSRTLMPSIKHFNLFSNPYLLGSIILALGIHVAVVYYAPLQAVFETVALTQNDWIRIISISSLGFSLMEVSKFFTSKNAEKA